MLRDWHGSQKCFQEIAKHEPNKLWYGAHIVDRWWESGILPSQKLCTHKLKHYHHNYKMKYVYSNYHSSILKYLKVSPQGV